jgi:hypothetical protein
MSRRVAPLLIGLLFLAACSDDPLLGPDGERVYAALIHR